MRPTPCISDDRSVEEAAVSLADRLISKMGPPWPGPAAYHSGLFQRVMRFACEMYGTVPQTAGELLERIEMSIEMCDYGIDELSGLVSIDINDVYCYCRGYFARVCAELNAPSAEGPIDFGVIDLDDLLKDRRSRWERVKDSVLARLNR